MKIFNYFAVILAITTIGITACSKDDENNSLATPEYESYAAKYDITTSGSPYSSIELTASGNYIITENGNNPSYSAVRTTNEEAKSFSFLSKKKHTTRTEFEGYKFGTYTVTGKNQYTLSGFGTLTIVEDGDNIYDLMIKCDNGQSITLGANRDNMYSSSEMTNNLCRTWSINKLHEQQWKDNQITLDETWEIGKYDSDPIEVIFTKAGTYMVFYADGTLDVSTWKWENESKGIMRYSWNLDYIDDPEESGSVTITFGDNTCTAFEEGFDFGYKWATTIYMTAK